MIGKIIFGALAVAAGVAAERKFKVSDKFNEFIQGEVRLDEDDVDDELDEELDDDETSMDLDDDEISGMFDED